jgi:hypothetical protein
VQHVIPLPEAAEYQIQIKEKERKEQKERDDQTSQYYKFWDALLTVAKEKTHSHVSLMPSKGDSLCVRKWRGAKLCYVANQYDGRVGLYIGLEEVALYNELHTHKDDIETEFGKPLLWGGKSNRIAYDIKTGGYKSDESEWQAIQTEMIDAMISLERALSPFIT